MKDKIIKLLDYYGDQISGPIVMNSMAADLSAAFEERLNGKYVLTHEELRAICCMFFRHWWNAPGNNTEQGFDAWALKINLKSRESNNQ